MALRAILFDFDETLADTLPGRAESLRHVLSPHLGRDVPTEEVLAIIRRASNLEDQVASLVADASLASIVVRAWREHYYRPEREPLRVYPGIYNLIASLEAAGLILGIVTSRYRLGPGETSNWGVLRELRQLDLTQRFSPIVGYEDSDRHKPEPDPFLIALEQLVMRPEEVLAVGDSASDVIGARAAGLRAAAALWGAYDRASMLAADPDILLERPMDLLSFI